MTKEIEAVEETVVNEIERGQLVMLYKTLKRDRENDEELTSVDLMVAIDFVDNLIVFRKQDGGRFFLHTPYEGELIYTPKKGGKPILLEKNLFGKYKFPKWGN